MQVSHTPGQVSAVFDDPNLVSCGGLAPVVALAQRCGLPELVADKLTLSAMGSANAHLKIPALVFGMVAGADSIDDMDLLRHGGMDRLFAGIHAPSTFGTFLRTFTFGHVRQLDSVAASLLTELATQTPLLAGVDQVTWIDVDDTIRATYGYAKQGAGFGYSGVKGLNALVAIVSTPLSRPVIAATRLRSGNANSARGAARLVADVLKTAKACGAGGKEGKGLVVLRADSAFYGHDVIAAARRAKVCFSITARMNPAVRKKITQIPDDAWTPIKYPNAVWDQDEQRLVSDAEIAEIEFTAFTSRRKGEQITGRLIVRRVKRLNPSSEPKAGNADKGLTAEQQELFAVYRYHAVFSDSPLVLVQAEKSHREHAIIEQVIADLKAGPLAHLPSSSFMANSAWLVLAAMAFNLTRSAGCLASTFHARATTATLRAHLINVPARLAHSARKLVLHLPKHWPWQSAWEQLWDATIGAPPQLSTS